MDFNGNGTRIWRPSVQRTDTVLPPPGNSINQQQLYTKTSLAASPFVSRSGDPNSNIQSMNREILNASQSYNNTPRPFVKHEVESPSVKSLSPILSPCAQRRNQPIYAGTSCNQAGSSSILRGPHMQQHKDDMKHQQGENMSPKLVHKQYNSPIDLYSMSNIRKTIEAHTEIIAPGVKGINFMKPDTQVNKQSEVYKLVMEEEGKRSQPCSPPALPTTSYQERPEQVTQTEPKPHVPQNTPITASRCSNQGYERFDKVDDHYMSTYDATQRARVTNLDPPKMSMKGPTCCECGQFIVGPFAKVQNRHVHPQCFNCATCGTSLKNTGYFTVNDKLYCEIHAKQIAKVMQINYEFGNQKEKSRQNKPSSSEQTPTQPVRDSHSQSQMQQSVKASYATSESTLNNGRLYGNEQRVPICTHCRVQIHGPYILAGKTTWCKQCSQTNFNCSSCRRSLLDTGIIEDSSHKHYCEHCFEAYYAPICSKCNIRIKGDCLNALGKQWHPSCFVCGHCRRPFGNSSFYLEDNVPYCERDWNMLFTTKCYSCSYPIEAGDKWVEALERNYHSNCFRCTSCQINLEGSTFYCKGGKPYCRLHAR